MWFWFLNCIINYNILYYKPCYILYSLEDNSFKMKSENFPLQYPAGIKNNTTLKDRRPVRAGGGGMSGRLSEWVSPAEQDACVDWGRRGRTAQWKELCPTEMRRDLRSNGRSLQKVGGGTQQRDRAARRSCSRPVHLSHLLHRGPQLTLPLCHRMETWQRSQPKGPPPRYPSLNASVTMHLRTECNKGKDKFIPLPGVCPSDHSLGLTCLRAFCASLCLITLLGLPPWTSSTAHWIH